MSAGSIRAAGLVLLLGVLVVWLVRPIGDPCGDLGKLPPGSSASSKPSFTPPLTRSCTYTTPEGTKARKRYVPAVDWLLLVVVAGLVGGAVALLGPGRERPRVERVARERARLEREARRRG